MNLVGLNYSNVHIPIFPPYTIMLMDKESADEGLEYKGLVNGKLVDEKKIPYIVGNVSKAVERYNPMMKMFTIIDDIEKLIYDNTDAVIDFCNVWGLIALPPGYDLIQWANKHDSIGQVSISEMYRADKAKPYDAKFEDSIFAAPLASFISGIKRVRNISSKLTEKKNQEKLMDNSISIIQETDIEDSINDILQGAKLGITTLQNGYYIKKYDFTTLTQAIGLCFYEIIIGKHRFRQCKYCKKLFIPTDQRQGYCPPDPDQVTKNKRGRPVSSCKVMDDARKRRKTKKEATEQ